MDALVVGCLFVPSSYVAILLKIIIIIMICNTSDKSACKTDENIDKRTRGLELNN
jgi:hypothetical protein